MSGREQNSELRVKAQRDEAYRQLDESLKLQRDAVHNRNSAVKRCAELKNDIATLNILHGNSGGTVGEIMSSSMWSKEAVHVRTFLGRYEPSDVNELCMRASAGIKGEDGRSVLLSWGNTDAAAFDPVKQKIISERDMEIYEHLSEKVLAPPKAELSRLLLRISWRKAGWLNSLFKWNWSGVDEETGERFKTRQMLAPDSKQPFPDIFNLPEMHRWETKKLSGAAGNVAQADGRGSECRSVDWCILHALAAAEDSSMGGMATAGTKLDPHLIMLTGDGAGLTEADSGVRIAVFVGSVRKLNQSTHAIYNLVFYKADSDAESYETIMARSAGIRPSLCRIYSDGQLLLENGEPSGIFVKLILTSDKPFLMKALGRRNMNHHYFSHSCGCGDENLYTLDFDSMTHYNCVTFEERCQRALVPLWEALGQPEPSTWTVTDMQGKVWTKAEVLELRARVDCMEKAQRTAFLDKWSMENEGQCFGHFPALPYHDVVIDYLHAYINEFNGANEEALHKHLEPDQYEDPEIKALATSVRDAVNAYLKQMNVNLVFGVKGKKHAANGPTIKKLLRDPAILATLITKMTPLYDLMEGKAHEHVKHHPTLGEKEDSQQHARETAGALQESAPCTLAGCAAAANAPKKARGRPPKKNRKLSFAEREKEASMSGSSSAPAPAPVQEPSGAPAAAPDPPPVRPTYLQRVSSMYYALACHWDFSHPHGVIDCKLLSAEDREARATLAAELGVELQRAMVLCMGTEKRRTYAHDLVYGPAKLYMLLGNPYLGATEGNEHAHQEMKKFFHQMCSHSSKSKCDCLQFMNLHKLKRIAVEELSDDIPWTIYSEMLTGKATGQKSARAGKAIKKDSDALIEDTKKNLSALLAPVNVTMDRGDVPFGSLPAFTTGEESARDNASPPASRKRAAEKSPAKDPPGTN
jgi:hypothetical protein